MTYQSARAKIVELIVSTEPTTLAHGLGAKFREVAMARVGSPPGARGFTLRGIADDVRTPLSNRTTRKRVCAMRLEVWYPSLTDANALDRVLREDHKAIGDRILRPDLWASETSGLISVEQNGGTLILHADVEERGSDDVVHVYRFDMEYLS